MGLLVMLTSLFVFIAGMVGTSFYMKSEHRSKDERGAFTSFVAYALGLTPMVYYLVTAMKDHVPAKASFALFFLICTLAWIMCAMILKDMKDEKKDRTSNYNYIVGLLVVTLILSFVFVFLLTSKSQNSIFVSNALHTEAASYTGRNENFITAPPPQAPPSSPVVVVQQMPSQQMPSMSSAPSSYSSTTSQASQVVSSAFGKRRIRKSFGSRR